MNVQRRMYKGGWRWRMEVEDGGGENETVLRCAAIKYKCSGFLNRWWLFCFLCLFCPF
jgi:hypothetical protein